MTDIPLFKPTTQEDLRRYRNKNFKIRIRKEREPLFKDEFILEATHNGQQWNQHISIAPHELGAIMKVLKKKEQQFKRKKNAARARAKTKHPK